MDPADPAETARRGQGRAAAAQWAAPWAQNAEACRSLSSTPTGNRNNQSANDAEEGKKKDKKKKAQTYQASASTVAEISSQDTARYFQIKDEELATLLPEGINADTKSFFEILGNKLVLLRESITETIDLLRKIQAGEAGQESFVRLLSGERGMGKSITMQLAVMFARSQGWIVMYVPETHKFVTEMGAIEYGTGTGAPLAASKLRPKLMTQPLGAQKILQWMKEAHGEQLSELKQQRKYPAKLYDNNDSLMAIVDRGLKTAPFAGDALLDLRLELGLVTKYPVLIAVDEINTLSWPTCFFDNAAPVVPERLMVTETFRFLNPSGEVRDHLKLARGLLLGASSSKWGYPVSPKIIADHKKKLPNPPTYFAPFNEFGDKVEVADESILMEAPRYTPEELRNTVISYKYCKVLDSPSALDPYKLKTLMAITGGIPREVHKFLWYPAFTLYAEPHPDVQRPNRKHNYSIARTSY
ncbi:28S ribosomal protein S29, mitochondrial [Hondaea fermentalgiana]|uniref:Small ribosomal subunit protein mS29 n=1 Tax=Hondaea fermentalgiana TaxID=2315210 RepID=A0A2R5GLQ7_9STRA|nr:28S ribosomal protein S29, mitochondrial [Hondaea fermentalgiana]|eukprot:GBG31565.1 28S ribosomal protein S29, mitochondrial [Hondaea fermentalgiana]